MRTFKQWLEAVATQNQRQLSTGNGGWNNNDDDSGGGGDDDDFENGPWGWKKMEGLNLQLFEWAKTSQAMRQIGQIISEHLFGQPPFNEQVRVFPNMCQIEIEWELNIDKWSELDNQIEAVLKRSDLYKPLGIDARELWNVVDKGAVYDYMMYVIILTLTGRGNGARSFLDNQASYYTWEYLKKNWPQQQQLVKQHIIEFYRENGMQVQQVQLMEPGRSFAKPTGVSQATNHASNLWGKGIAQIQYKASTSQPHPDIWHSFGDERNLRQH